MQANRRKAISCTQPPNGVIATANRADLAAATLTALAQAGSASSGVANRSGDPHQVLHFFFCPSFLLFLSPSFLLFLSPSFLLFLSPSFLLFLSPSFLLFLSPSFLLFFSS